MKATLEFNLPEEKHEFESAVKGGAAISVLWEFDQILRTRVKYEGWEDPRLTKAEKAGIEELVEMLRTVLWEEINERRVPVE